LIITHLCFLASVCHFRQKFIAKVAQPKLFLFLHEKKTIHCMATQLKNTESSLLNQDSKTLILNFLGEFLAVDAQSQENYRRVYLKSNEDSTGLQRWKIVPNTPKE
jgi:hypothetical protein